MVTQNREKPKEEKISVTKLGAVVIDNATAMVKALTIIKQKYPHNATYTCAAHTIHLIISNIKLKTAEEMVATCKAVVKEIDGSEILQVYFAENQKKHYMFSEIACCNQMGLGIVVVKV